MEGNGSWGAETGRKGVGNRDVMKREHVYIGRRNYQLVQPTYISNIGLYHDAVQPIHVYEG
jgi:hypothetical protein